MSLPESRFSTAGGAAASLAPLLVCLYLAMKWELVLSMNLYPAISTPGSWWRENRPFKRNVTMKPDAEGNQTPIFLCSETDADDEMVSFYGPDCTSPFVEWLEELAVDQDWDDRNVIVIFHNLKGYNGMFILQHCYKVHREVTDQITVGTKILSLTSD